MIAPSNNAIYDGLLRSAAASALFSEERRLQSILDVEAALAETEAELGIIPADAVGPIRACCLASKFDRDVLQKGVARSGNLAIPVVGELTKAVSLVAPAAAKYVHWGATSQDVLDTGLVLQLRDLLNLTEQQLSALDETLSKLTERYRATAMAGRTWLQQAVPITFGLKTAGWLDTIHRHQERLRQLKPRVLVVQFGGAAGTLASLKNQGEDVAQGLAARLGLSKPALPWHTHRDRLAEVAAFFGLLMGSLGKISGDLALMGQTEIGEVAEPFGEGRGGSSTMPHKRNPVGAAAILSSAIRVPGLVGTMLSAMRQEHERGLGGWHAEWETLPEICSLSSGALENLQSMLAGLQVFPEVMLASLKKTDGLLMAESVSTVLAESLGKAQAHAIVEAASHRAVKEQVPLLTVLESDASVTRHLNRAELQDLFDPASYLGSTNRFIQAVLEDRPAEKPSHVTAHSAEGRKTGLHYSFNYVPGKPVLALSNSLGTDLRMWDDQISAFSHEFSVLRYDTRGHGRSFRPAGPYTIQQMALDVLDLLDELGLKQVYYCGLSLGGMVGQWLGIHAPERLSMLVLSNTAAKIGTTKGWNDRIRLIQEAGMAAVVPAVLDRWFTPHFREVALSRVETTQRMLLATSPEGYIASCAAVRDMDFRDSLHTISVPTLVVYGIEDPVTPPDAARFLIENISGAQSLALSAAHLANVECAAEFTTGVLRFLTEKYE